MRTRFRRAPESHAKRVPADAQVAALRQAATGVLPSVARPRRARDPCARRARSAGGPVRARYRGRTPRPVHRRDPDARDSWLRSGRLETGPKAFKPAADPGFHRSERLPQMARELGVGESLEERESDRLLLSGFQRLDAGAHRARIG